ncbi:hypothetical protein HID58_070285 [Brassica napus]|uniref:Uncharacterized protein n=1 Tax=Brassica napus TaxID=3708 RepID=A0ABQ7YYD5_BRANA|nr:hypothetical protein HID58_070285 [Brassica napus]
MKQKIQNLAFLENLMEEVLNNMYYIQLLLLNKMKYEIATC